MMNDAMSVGSAVRAVLWVAPRLLISLNSSAHCALVNAGSGPGRKCEAFGSTQLFVQTLGEACAKTGWQVHAYRIRTR